MKQILRRAAAGLSQSIERCPALHRWMKLQFLKLPAWIRGEQIVFDGLKLLAREANKVFFIQIGANDGVSNDPLHYFIRKHGWTGIVVEPVPSYFEELKHNYKGCEITFENVAISEERERRTFYYLKGTDGKLASWAKGVGSFYKENLTALRDSIPNFDQCLVSEELQCVPLADVLDRNEVMRIDLLVIDAEGYDGKILMQFDFNRLKPKAVIFEHKLLESSELKECDDELRRHGYSVARDAYDTVASLVSEGER